jgi:hypothetical protein
MIELLGPNFQRISIIELFNPIGFCYIELPNNEMEK